MNTANKNISYAKCFKWMTWVLLIGLLLNPNQNAHADIGPKPTMEFIFVQENDPPLTIIDGTLLECTNFTCDQAEPLEEFGPQGFQCTQDSCSSMAYGYSEYHRLVIEFSDGKVRESNVFEKQSFNTNYQVTVRADDLVVEEDIWRSSSASSMFRAPLLGLCLIPVLLVVALTIVVWMSIRSGKGDLTFSNLRAPYILAWVITVPMLIGGGIISLSLPLTVIIETMLAVVYAILRRRSTLTILTIVILVNLITQPLLLLALSIVDTQGQTAMLAFLISIEIVIWLAEAIMLYLPQRNDSSFRAALGLSLILNATSFLIGLLLRA